MPIKRSAHLSLSSPSICYCQRLFLTCFSKSGASFDAHLDDCGTCQATFSYYCLEHGSVLVNAYREELSRVCSKTRLPCCSGSCSDSHCLCVHLHSDHPSHWTIPFVSCYDNACCLHERAKGLGDGIIVPLYVANRDTSGCPCDRWTCNCSGYTFHPRHQKVNCIYCYQHSCGTHHLQKDRLQLYPEDPYLVFNRCWLERYTRSLSDQREEMKLREISSNRYLDIDGRYPFCFLWTMEQYYLQRCVDIDDLGYESGDSFESDKSLVMVSCPSC
jgi:hypothetical protein